MTRTRLSLLATAAAVALGTVAASVALPSSPQAEAASSARTSATWTPPQVRHVFVVNLENKGYDKTFGAGSKAPYLATTLRGQGQLLTQYYGTAHHSLPNYVAQISGQGPSRQTQADCKVYSKFVRTGTAAPGQAVGHGCVYPTSVRTLATQLSTNGFTWRGYMEDMGATGCRHPKLGAKDGTQKARKGDQYAARHNPFVYFRSITSRTAWCRSHDVGLGHLTKDLERVRTTRNLSYITPNLCNDGHDSPCVDGRPGGLVSANAWLKRWIPKILASPAFRKDGLLVVTFDEADGDSAGSADACCGEGAGPNAALPGITGPGGGRVGAVLVSPYIVAGTTNAQEYNHYSLLRSIEDWFGLGRLGYAKQARAFGADVFEAGR